MSVCFLIHYVCVNITNSDKAGGKKMTKIKKITILALSLLMMIAVLVGVLSMTTSKNVYASSVGNSQNYKGGKVKFQDYLFDENSLEVKSLQTVGAEIGQDMTKYVTSMATTTYSRGTLNVTSTNTIVSAGEITAVFIKHSPDSNGNVKWFFAYVGIPHTDANGNPVSASNPVPAVVCVHGGGGTAYSAWVTYWMNRGYAAIAMDTVGCVPKVNSSGTYGRMDDTGENINGIYLGNGNVAFADCNKGVKIEDQWFYSATSTVIASTTYLRSNPLIANDKIAITGISYGSYLTCLATAYDGRYCAAVPVYGSLGQQYGDTYFANNVKNNPQSAEVWDNLEPLYENKVPMLFVTGNTDPHFSVLSTSLSVDKIPNAKMHLVHEYPHGHTPGIVVESAQGGYGETASVYQFIGRYCYLNEWDFGNVLTQPTINKGKISSECTLSSTDMGDYYYTVVEVPSAISVTSATVYYTYNQKLINNSQHPYYCESHPSGNDANGFSSSGEVSTRINLDIYGDYYYQYRTIWNSESAQVVQTTSNTGATVYVIKTATSNIDNAYYYYFTITDSAGHKVSSNVVTRKFTPDMYYRLYAPGGASTYDYACDTNGWATAKDGGLFLRSVGNGDTGVHMDPTSTSATFPTIINEEYGSKYSSCIGGKTSLIMENNYVMNYKAYDVYKPIEFYYNVSKEGDVLSDTSTSGKAWFTFALFDDVQKGYLARTLNSDTLGSYFSSMDQTLKARDTSLNSAQAVAPKLALTSSNTNGTVGGIDVSGYYNKFNVKSFVNNGSSSSFAEEDGLIKVTILVLDDKTEVYANDVLVYTDNSVTRSSFRWYKAYLTLATHNEGGSVELDLRKQSNVKEVEVSELRLYNNTSWVVPTIEVVFASLPDANFTQYQYNGFSTMNIEYLIAIGEKKAVADFTYVGYTNFVSRLASSYSDLEGTAYNPSLNDIVTIKAGSYVFDGVTKYVIKKDVSFRISDITQTANGSYVLCSSYVPSFTVTFDSNGGSSVQSQTITQNQTATEPTVPTKENCTFVGWFVGETEFNFGTLITENIALTAKWQENEPIDPNPGGGSEPDNPSPEGGDSVTPNPDDETSGDNNSDGDNSGAGNSGDNTSDFSCGSSVNGLISASIITLSIGFVSLMIKRKKQN